MSTIGDMLAGKGHQVISVDAGTTVHEAAMQLSKHYIGAVVVSDDEGQMIGILSETDIARGLAKFGAEIMSKCVEDLMTSKVVACPPSETIVRTMRLMESKAIRHLPVVENGKVVGIISMRDIVSEWITILNIDHLMDKLTAESA